MFINIFVIKIIYSYKFKYVENMGALFTMRSTIGKKSCDGSTTHSLGPSQSCDITLSE